MKIESIDVLMPEVSQYDALHNFTRSIYKALVRLGYRCRLVEVKDHFTLPVKTPPDLTIAINGIPANEDGLLLCELNDTTHLAYLIDPPYRYLHLLRSPHVIVGNDDKAGCRLLQERNIPNVFIPHGVEQEITVEENQKRDLDIVFIATYIDYNKRRETWREKYGSSVEEAMQEAAETTLGDSHSCFMNAFENAYNALLQRGLAKSSAIPIVDILTDLELYIKGRSRAELVRAVRTHPLHLFNGSLEKGYGWEKLVGENSPNVTIHPPMHYDETFSILKRAKIVLNTFIKNKEGGHDRIFSGMACQALVATNENLFMKEHFKNRVELLLYKPWQLEKLEEQIAPCLADAALRESIAMKGRDAVMKKHTWDLRFKEVLETLKQTK